MKTLNKLARIKCRVRRAQNGIALIEALIALLIFMFGVLGLIGLQGLMVRNQTDAKFRTDASFLANEVIGLAASDKVNIASYATTAGGPCTYAQCASWIAKVQRSLPAGIANVVYTSASGDLSVTLTWAMPDGTVHQYVMETIIR